MEGGNVAAKKRNFGFENLAKLWRLAWLKSVGRYGDERPKGAREKAGHSKGKTSRSLAGGPQTAGPLSYSKERPNCASDKGCGALMRRKNGRNTNT